jgi:anti-sigma regulatory factor (Ser/Thr protein kinase)
MEKLSVPAALDSLAAIRHYAREAATRAGIDAERAYKLQLAVDEVATNIISHGYKDAGPSAVISISSEIRANSLVVTLEDHAPAFDPRTVRLPDAEDLATPLEDRPIGGLGLFLAIQGVDRFDYRREGNLNLNIFEVDVRRH